MYNNENLGVVEKVEEINRSAETSNKEKKQCITTLGLYSGDKKKSLGNILTEEEYNKLKDIVYKIYSSGTTLEIYYDKGVL